MRSLPLILPLAGAALADAPLPLTLDPAMYADALREVRENRRKADETAPQAAEAHAPTQEAAEWCLAMEEAGTAQGEVRLVLLLQRLNPTAGVGPLADALTLHRLALAGNARACGQLAAALRSGTLPGGLAFIRSEELAQAVEARAVRFQLSSGPEQPGQQAPPRPSAATASGASG